MRLRTILLGAIAAAAFAASAFAFWHGQSNNCMSYQPGLCALYDSNPAHIILVR